MENVFSNNGFLVIAALLVIYFAALICSVSVFTKSLATKRCACEVLRLNMVIKLVHIPAYVIIFILGFAFMLTIFTFAISIVLWILDVMTIILSGLIGLSGVIRSYREEKISKKSAIIHGILQFVFCLDVISAIIVYRRTKAGIK